MTSKENWVLMPVRNCRYLTEQAIKAVFAQDIPIRLLVINNHSTDGAAEYIRSLYPVAQVVSYVPAKGVSYSWNRGLNYLFSHGCQHVLVLNNDTEIRKDTYRLLRDTGEGFITAVGVDSRENATKATVNTVNREPHPDFSCFLIRRWVWEKVGKFDESMVIYASDGDYHLRMIRAGIKAVKIDLPFYHVASGTIKGANKRTQQEIHDQADADRAVFAKKWGVEMGTPEYEALFL